MSKDLLIFMTRLPEIGCTKTRLEDFLTKDAILALNQRLIRHNFEIVSGGPYDLMVFVTSHDPHLQASDFLPLDDSVKVLRQGEGNEGDRMAWAFHYGFKAKYARIVLVGSDLYDLTATLIDEAFEALIDHDVVVTPTFDGGYGLVGQRIEAPEIFALESYGHSYVYEQVLDKIAALNLRGCAIGRMRDIDTKIDIARILSDDPNASFLAQGEYNVNFLFDKGRRLLRINLGSQMYLDHQMAYEFETLKALEETGVTPKAYTFVEDAPLFGLAYLVEEYLPGRPLRYESADLKKAAEILAKIHAVDIKKAPHLLWAKTPFLTMMDEFEAMFSRYENWPSRKIAIAQRIRTWLEELKTYDLKAPLEQPCIVNTELNSSNFLINESDRSYLIDWEKSLISEREQDLGHFLAPTTTLWKTDDVLGADDLKIFIQAYNAHSQVPINLGKLMQYLRFTCLRGLTWCAMAYVEYHEGSKALTNDYSLKVIEKYLSHDFLDDIAAYFEVLDCLIV